MECLFSAHNSCRKSLDSRHEDVLHKSINSWQIEIILKNLVVTCTNVTCYANCQWYIISNVWYILLNCVSDFLSKMNPKLWYLDCVNNWVYIIAAY